MRDDMWKMPQDTQQAVAPLMAVFNDELTDPIANLVLSLPAVSAKFDLPNNMYAGLVANGLVCKAAIMFFCASIMTPELNGRMDDDLLDLDDIKPAVEQAINIIVDAVQRQIRERHAEILRKENESN